MVRYPGPLRVLRILSARRAIKALSASIALLISTVAAGSEWTGGFDWSDKPGDRVWLLASPYTKHYRPSPEHKYVWLIGAARERADGALAGVAVFSNSFGQPSAYIFPWGKIYRNVLDHPNVYAKWSAGLLYGYREQYEDKVPMNKNGFSPGFIPALGWEFNSSSQAQVNFLGLNAVMLQFSVRGR